ncbi:MAG: hypothetical protein OXB93_01805 [Cytophagales bacterium]|nr:hypothetical protein [Cytophagales bacterium]
MNEEESTWEKKLSCENAILKVLEMGDIDSPGKALSANEIVDMIFDMGLIPSFDRDFVQRNNGEMILWMGKAGKIKIRKGGDKNFYYLSERTGTSQSKDESVSIDKEKNTYTKVILKVLEMEGIDSPEKALSANEIVGLIFAKGLNSSHDGVLVTKSIDDALVEIRESGQTKYIQESGKSVHYLPGDSSQGKTKGTSLSTVDQNKNEEERKRNRVFDYLESEREWNEGCGAIFGFLLLGGGGAWWKCGDCLNGEGGIVACVIFSILLLVLVLAAGRNVFMGFSILVSLLIFFAFLAFLVWILWKGF